MESGYIEMSLGLMIAVVVLICLRFLGVQDLLCILVKLTSGGPHSGCYELGGEEILTGSDTTQCDAFIVVALDLFN
jgi:hypothetical protein